jgi:primosomal protein N' (replication factor Y)
LNDEQQQAVAAVAAQLGEYQPFLLDGVTGSGKTEVYLALIEQVLAQGKQALLLVPEIGLAPQTVRRLRERLGVIVEVLHSNLSEGDRARAWLRARNGSARVILGTRSAVFTPLPQGRPDHRRRRTRQRIQAAGRLSLPRARSGRGARTRAERAGAAGLGYAVAGIAGQCRGRPLSHAASARAAPARSGRRRCRSSTCARSGWNTACRPRCWPPWRKRVARGEQALVFRNRRGYAPVLLCHSCGWHATARAATDR